MMPESTTKKPTVPYAPFKTFLSAVEALEHGLPNTIDRTVWPTFSGVIQSQILGAFRFLGLIQHDGTPTADLRKLVDEPANRKATLGKIIERSYPDVVKQGLTKMSMGNLGAAMRQYSVTGATLRKAISFFLQAVRYAELPLSPYILKQTRNVSAGRKRRAPTVTPPKGHYVSEITGIADNGSAFGGPSKTIALEKGITLSLKTSTDTFNMSAADRKFVLQLLEQLEKYEAEHADIARQNDQEGQ
jgi:hypothetical protein